MKKAIVGIGIPGSGKTTFLREFAEKNQYVYISPDLIREDLTGNKLDQGKNTEVWRLAYERVIAALQKGETIVFDATFTNEVQRRQFLDFLRENGAEKIQGLFVDAPLEVAKERNRTRELVVPESVLENMNRGLQSSLPALVDGFDSVFTIDEHQQLKEVETWKATKEFKLR